MKRLLLTLLTFLFMAICAFAECSMYIENIELKRSELGTVITVPVKAHFSAKVSAFQVNLTYPEGLTASGAVPGSDMCIVYINSDGEESTCYASLGMGSYYQKFIAAIMDEGYWQNPNGEDPTAWVSYGSIKWEAGDYDEMFLLRLKPNENFTGGDINITFEPASGPDARGETVNDIGDLGPFHSVCHVTVTDDTDEQTEPPIIYYSVNDETATVIATGEGEVKLYKDGLLVENPCTIPRTNEDQTFTFTATAHEEGKLISETTTLVVDVPAKPMERCKTPAVSYGVTAVGVATITITNNEEGATVYYWVYRDGDLITENSFTGDSHRFEVSGIGSYTLQAIAKKEGMLDSYAGGIFFMIVEDPLPVTLGDVNYDGMINITDLNAMLNIIFYDWDFVVAADMNKDMIINVQDVVGLVHYLLNGEIPSISSNGRRAPKTEAVAQACLYWQDGVLYLNSDVPVSALNIINDVEGDITWNLDQYGMVVMQSTGTQGEHSVIFSFDRSTIPSGVSAIATTNCQHPSVVGAELSNLDSELISVNLNDQLTGLTSIQSDNEFNCHMDGTSLIINSGAALRDIDVSFITIDGRVLANQHMSFLNSGSTSIDMSDILKGNCYLIIVVRNGRQILATQKITQNR